MKKIIILAILLSGFSLAEAQSGWQKELENISVDLGEEIAKLTISQIGKTLDAGIDEVQLKIEMDKLQANLMKDINAMQINLDKDLAMTFRNNEGHFSIEINETKQFQGDMFERLADIKGVEVVYISKSLLGMMPKMSMPGVNIGNVAGKLEGLQIFSAEQKNAVKTLKSESDRLVKNGKYETAMFVKDDDSKTVFYLKKISDKQSEMLMVTEEPTEITIIRFLGNFTMQDIQDLTKEKKEKNK